MLNHRLRRWSINKTTLVSIVFAGLSTGVIMRVIVSHNSVSCTTVYYVECRHNGRRFFTLVNTMTGRLLQVSLLVSLHVLYTANKTFE